MAITNSYLIKELFTPEEAEQIHKEVQEESAKILKKNETLTEKLNKTIDEANA